MLRLDVLLQTTEWENNESDEEYLLEKTLLLLKRNCLTKTCVRSWKRTSNKCNLL